MTSTCTCTTPPGITRTADDVDAIPRALLSSDETESGTETFTDQDTVSNREFGYRVCYFGGSVPTEVTLTITARALDGGGQTTQTFTLDREGECRRAGALAQIPPDTDEDLDGVLSETDNCPAVCEPRPGRQRRRRHRQCLRRDPGRRSAAASAAPPPPPPPPLPPTPELGKSVVAGKVSGTIRVKSRNGTFRTLGADESIPLGSTVDATKGKVRITSAANAAGATQSALFFQGAFVITQTRGSKPVTQLALSGRLSCPKGKGEHVARRKKSGACGVTARAASAPRAGTARRRCAGRSG